MDDFSNFDLYVLMETRETLLLGQLQEGLSYYFYEGPSSLSACLWSTVIIEDWLLLPKMRIDKLK